MAHDCRSCSHPKRIKTSDDSSKSPPVHKNTKTIRLFGVNIIVYSNDREDVSPSSSCIPSASCITPEVKKTKENSSRKRKRGNPNHHHQQLLEVVVVPPRILPYHRVFLFEKILQHSDVDRGQNRLLIGKIDADKVMAVLTEEERKKVNAKEGDFLRVVTTTSDRDEEAEYTLHLKKWFSSGAIVLKHEWSKLVKANGLEKEDSVQAWGYRVGDEFRLALFIINKPN